MSGADYDVAVVGLGPVGAFSALALAGAGLRVAVIERNTGPVTLPRVVAIDGESQRQFQRIGLGDALEAMLQPPRAHDEVWFTTSELEKLFGVTIDRCGPNGWRDLAYFDQPEFEAMLRDLAVGTDGIDTFVGHEVCDIVEDGDAAVVHTTPAGDESPRLPSMRAPYVLGCDGASSFVRRSIGAAWEDLGYDQDWLVVDVTLRPGAGTELPIETMQVCDPDRLTTYVSAKDPNRRWEFRLREGEERDAMLEPERITEFVRPWLAPEHYDIRRAAVYQFHAATARPWRRGRVFLAGDAAHQMPPFLGQGVNSGFHDSVNFAWKLALVLRRGCDPSLLDTYEAERSGHAQNLVERAVYTGRLMETLAAREAGMPDPHPDIDARLPEILGDGPVPPLQTGILVEDQIGPGRPAGRLLRQPIVRQSPDGRVDSLGAGAGGDAVRLDDLFGPNLAVVGRTGADVELAPDARAVFDTLGGRAVALDRLEVVDGEIDPLFGEHPAALVRPDRYVFGVVDGAHDIDDLVVDLGRRLGLPAAAGDPAADAAHTGERR